jgi:endogenous inhibitor of DNA gyrase (YacG/DUF329 family)
MHDEQLESPDTLCPHCAADATWGYLDDTKEIVEIVCPECGRFEVPRAEFEAAEFDIAQAEERRS